MREFNGKDKFEDRLNIVLDELSLGIQWARPSLILAVYRSEVVKNLVQTALAKSLVESGQAVFHYVVDKFHYDIPVELLEHPNHDQAIFFVSGLRWGGGRGYSNAYRALNMHREILVEGRIKVIFWLTKLEAIQVTRHAPDFWAFRHQVVEFLDLPSTQIGNSVSSSKNTFHNMYNITTTDFQGWINTAEELLTQGCYDEALENYQKALRKYPGETAIYLQIAEIQLSMGRYQAARSILKKMNKPTGKNANLLIELDRLKQTVSSQQHAHGGFLEQST
jgi:tetratricopeptide (TPR) repeat protein